MGSLGTRSKRSTRIRISWTCRSATRKLAASELDRRDGSRCGSTSAHRTTHDLELGEASTCSAGPGAKLPAVKLRGFGDLETVFSAILTGEMHAGISTLLFLCIFDAFFVSRYLNRISRMLPESSC